MSKPAWLVEADKLLGLKEIPGPRHSPEILQMWKDIKRGGIKDDETPWCAAFVGAMLERAGITSSRFESAKSYEKWGVALAKPVYGCVIVMTRKGGGHVGFVVGVNSRGQILVQGGNQDNQVNIRAFPADRTANAVYRYPAGYLTPSQPLPVLSDAQLSKTEA